MKLSYLLIILFFTGCASSLYPITTPENVIYKKEALGKWKSDGTTIQIDQYLNSDLRNVPLGKADSLKTPVTAEQKKANAFAARSYLISYTENDILHVYEGRFTQIGRQLYAEIVPYSLGTHHDPLLNFENTYSIARVDFSEKKMVLTFLNGEKIRQLVLNGNLKISYEHEKIFDHFMITANTTELRQFLVKYGHDDRLFNKNDVVILTKQ